MNTQPMHYVNIGYDFEMSKYPVTIKQYHAIRQTLIPGYEMEYVDRPKTGYTWKEIITFLEMLNTHSETISNKYLIRLCTEAEWEYVARAGFDDIQQHPSEYMNITSSQDVGNVGQFKPNAFGVHDLFQSVFTICEDHYASTYEHTPTDGSAYLQGDEYFRVFRGSAFPYNFDVETLTDRGECNMNLRSRTKGIRLVRVSKQ